MKRILFVDDEPRILEGLQRMLRAQRREWQMVFAPGGEAAMAELTAAPFDVVVTDMRMPGVDGLALLTHVQQQSPGAIRIILSGHTDADVAARATRVAHQFLVKPSSPEIIKEVIDRSCELGAAMQNEHLKDAVGRVISFPTLPSVYARLSEALDRPDVTPEQLADLLVQDIGMCAKILHTVNSSFFGISREVTDVRAAAHLLGVNTIRTLFRSAEIFHPVAPSLEHGSALGELYLHSLRVARLAEEMYEDADMRQTAFMAGLLHDFGKLLLAHAAPEAFAEVTRVARAQSLPFHVVEAERLGVTHAELGAYLLGLWSLPRKVVEAVARHHAPDATADAELDLAAAVRAADAIANLHFSPVAESAAPGGGRLGPIS